MRRRSARAASRVPSKLRCAGSPPRAPQVAGEAAAQHLRLRAQAVVAEGLQAGLVAGNLLQAGLEAPQLTVVLARDQFSQPTRHPDLRFVTGCRA